jgi:Zn-dependent M28 family amino/carboxypeptidase
MMRYWFTCAALVLAGCVPRTVAPAPDVPAPPSVRPAAEAPAAPAAVTHAAAVLPAAAAIDSARLLRDLGVLAHDSMEGRATGTPGNARARAFLERAFAERGIQPFGASYLQSFTFVRRDNTLQGVNVIGVVRGTELPEQYIVVTAHYDHIGIRNGEIYNGADDNASGVAALLAFGEHFAQSPPRHSIIFAALDAEEMSLQGARAFVANPPVPRSSIVLNVNMDMVGRNDANELYVAGTYHYPQLLPIVEVVAAGAEVRLIPGHDRPGREPGDDWTNLSDHGVFHAAGIPFLYFGVEDHPDYHRPTDTVDGIQPAFYNRAARTILTALRLLDQG